MIYDDELDDNSDHTEITISNSKLMLIFLGVAIAGGACFGFGYSLGKHSAAPVKPVVVEPAPALDSASMSGNKPSAGSNGSRTSPSASPSAVDNGRDMPSPTDSAVPARSAAKPSKTSAASAKSATDAASPAARSTVAHAAVPANPASTGSQSERTYVVQVAAVSHKGDADILVSALRRKGYQVSANSSPQDALIHVQVGPFATQKDALAMRDRLSNDGYLAIVK